MMENKVKECEFYDLGYCRCGDTRVPLEIGYSDILCSVDKDCYFKQNLALKEKLKYAICIIENFVSTECKFTGSYTETKCDICNCYRDKMECDKFYIKENLKKLREGLDEQ